MSRIARISTPVEAAARPYVVVPVVFDEGAAFVAQSIPTSLGGQTIARVLSEQWCADNGLQATAGSTVTLRTLDGTSVILVSIGSTYNDAENFRIAGASSVRGAASAPVAFFMPTDGIEDPRAMAQAFVEGALLASYDYRAAGDAVDLDVVPLGLPLPSVIVHDQVTEGVARAGVVAESVNWAKRLIDTPASEMTPKELARLVELRLRDDEHVTIRSWNEATVKDERLGGLAGVAQGSAQPARLVYATYDPQPKVELPHVALVGKGVTFDSGGLSLKSADGMTTMKTDMSGAAIVMAVLSIASRLQLNIRLTAIAPMTENLPSDRAIKPGDVLTIRNGMTVEVLNTDAEGRLILADGLSLAVEANPDAIVDVATLTGAQRVALGDDVGALFASTDELAQYFADASGRSGEQTWRLPLVEQYESHIDSDVADMKNTGKAGAAGTISAALFLRRFTDGRPWVHLDIAGPGRSDSAHGYYTKGATAFGARTIVEFLEAVEGRSSAD